MRATPLAYVFALVTAALSARSSRAEANPPATYRANVRRWHDSESVPAPRFTEDGRLVLRLHSINALGNAEVTPRTAEGGFDEAACDEVARVLGDARVDPQRYLVEFGANR